MKRLWYLLKSLLRRDKTDLRRELYHEEHDPYVQWLKGEGDASKRRSRHDLTRMYGYRDDEEGPR